MEYQEEEAMATPKYTKQVLSHEQAKSQIVENLTDLSFEALNEVVVFVEFLRFREKNTKEGKSDDNSDVSEFAGMLSDLTPEEIQRFDDAVKRRSLFANQETDL
jgi:hypothetical protein